LQSCQLTLMPHEALRVKHGQWVYAGYAFLNC
jgi:hypothetical protein